MKYQIWAISVKISIDFLEKNLEKITTFISPASFLKQNSTIFERVLQKNGSHSWSFKVFQPVDLQVLSDVLFVGFSSLKEVL